MWKLAHSTRTASHRHFANEGVIVGDIDRDRGGPDLAERLQRLAQFPQIIGTRPEIVVDEDRVRLIAPGERQVNNDPDYFGQGIVRAGGRPTGFRPNSGHPNGLGLPR